MPTFYTWAGNQLSICFYFNFMSLASGGSAVPAIEPGKTRTVCVQEFRCFGQSLSNFIKWSLSVQFEDERGYNLSIHSINYIDIH